MRWSLSSFPVNFKYLNVQNLLHTHRPDRPPPGKPPSTFSRMMSLIIHRQRRTNIITYFISNLPSHLMKRTTISSSMNDKASPQCLWRIRALWRRPRRRAFRMIRLTEHYYDQAIIILPCKRQSFPETRVSFMPVLRFTGILRVLHSITRVTHWNTGTTNFLQLGRLKEIKIKWLW